MRIARTESHGGTDREACVKEAPDVMRRWGPVIGDLCREDRRRDVDAAVVGRSTVIKRKRFGRTVPDRVLD